MLPRFRLPLACPHVGRYTNHGDDEVNPIASTAAFAHFEKDHVERREGDVEQQTATLSGPIPRRSGELRAALG